MMERIRGALQEQHQYRPIRPEHEEHEEEEFQTQESAAQTSHKSRRFSYLEYGIFVLLGVSMLWAYNMFLAAGPYFQHRFRRNKWVLENFQAGEIAVSTTTGLVAMLVLTRLQAKASYPRRILSSLFINMVIFILLAASTKTLLGVSAGGYFTFIMIMNFCASLATSLCQNGIFAFVASFNQPSYTQGIMTGQAIAGVLPCIAQIVSVLSVSDTTADELADDKVDLPTVPSSAAMLYFLLAVAVSVATLGAFIILLRRQSDDMTSSITSESPLMSSQTLRRRAIPLTTLASKLRYLASAVFITFAITMLFPVFTQLVVSVSNEHDRPRILQPEIFIPLAFLCWNVGDLTGRLLTAVPALVISHRPKLLLFCSLARFIFPVLYFMCNIRGHGAVIPSDLFYLVLVQGLFGLTNGYLGSLCMIGAGMWVEEDEQEAAGSFMALCLVAGLAAGSLSSFLVANL